MYICVSYNRLICLDALAENLAGWYVSFIKVLIYGAVYMEGEEDPRRRNNFSFALPAEILAEVVTKYKVEKEKKNNCRPLAAKHPAAARSP